MDNSEGNCKTNTAVANEYKSCDTAGFCQRGEKLYDYTASQLLRIIVNNSLLISVLLNVP